MRQIFVTLCLIVFAVATASLIDRPTSVYGNNDAVIKVKPSDIIYYFSNQKNQEGTGVKYDAVGDAKPVFDLNKNTLILIHGWLDGNNSNFNTVLKSAALSKYDINVIVVDWSKVAKGEYLIVKSQIPSVGQYAGEFLSNLTNILKYPLSKFKLVGHSLGAHISGIIGKHFDGKIEQIVGVDPAGPFISQNESHRLQKTDAKFVHVIHTSSGKTGMGTALGHADYYPNGGAKQPGCGVDIVGSCAHVRSFWLYAESLTNNQFYAQKCNSYKDFEAHTCTGESLMGGYNVDTKASGIYYLDTNSKSPYGKGKI